MHKLKKLSLLLKEAELASNSTKTWMHLSIFLGLLQHQLHYIKVQSVEKRLLSFGLVTWLTSIKALIKLDYYAEE